MNLENDPIIKDPFIRKSGKKSDPKTLTYYKKYIPAPKSPIHYKEKANCLDSSQILLPTNVNTPNSGIY